MPRLRTVDAKREGRAVFRSIRGTIHRIKQGFGAHEVALGEEMVPTRTALLPLMTFSAYVRRGKYPPPELVEYVSLCLERVVAGADLDSAFLMKRPPGRPSDDSKLDEREHKSFLGWEVLRRTRAGETTEAVLDELAEREPYSKRNIERAYRRAREEERQISRAVARNHRESDPESTTD